GERVVAAGALRQLRDLRVDVEGLRVVEDGAAGGHVERAVPGRAPLGEAEAGERAGGVAIDAHALHRGAGPRPPNADEEVAAGAPLGVDVVAGGDVLPVDDGGAGRPVTVGRAADHDPGRVRHGADRGRVDLLLVRGRVGREAGGGARDEELLLDVA